MEAQTNNTDQEAAALALLGKAAAVPGGAKLRAFDPMETIPTIGVDSLAVGQVISGTYVRTETLASPKFKKSQRLNEAGVPTQDRHILRLASGELLALWTTGELRMVFAKIQAGQVISLTYKGKGTNNQGNAQHFFDYKLSEGNTVQ